MGKQREKNRFVIDKNQPYEITSIHLGITGCSQVYMKRQHDVNFKAWFDSEYVKRMSIIPDIKILLHTIFFLKEKSLLQKNINVFRLFQSHSMKSIEFSCF